MNIVGRDPARLIWDTFDGSKGWDDVLEDLGRWASDFNATFRDLRKLYRFRIKGESQR